MTKKVLILLLALSMACSTMFAGFAMDEDSANETSEQSSSIITKEQSELANTDETELDNEGQVEETTTDEEAAAVEEMNAPSLLSDPPQETEPEEEKYGTVKLMDMWTEKSSKKISFDRSYKSSDEKIGKPAVNGGLLRGLAKTFLAWSDKKPERNGHLAEGARYFSPEDTIGTVFPNGIPEGAELYAVYFSLIDEDKGLSTDSSGDLKIMSELRNSQNKIIELINSEMNRVVINKAEIISADDTMPDTGIYKETKTDQERTIFDYYKKDADNEVVLTSEFSMDPVVALVVYKNPVGSNQLRPILSRDYNDRRGDAGDFNTDDGGNAEYTYVDLNVNLDKQFKIPETLYLEFFGYSWRPLYVMDENKTRLEILNPNDENSLGNDKNSFTDLVSKTDPKVRFAIKPNGASSITVRLILRDKEDYHGGAQSSYDERIAESDVKALQGQTITETILSNMTLRSLTKADIIKLNRNLTNDQLNNRTIRISDEKAQELAKSNGEKSLLVNGNIKGHMFVSAGEAKKGPFTIRLKSDTEIRQCDSNNLKLGYVPNNVYYKFVSGTKGKVLPDEILSKLPKDRLIKNKDGVLDQDKVDLSAYSDVKVHGGVWTFKTWYVTNDEFENDPNLKEVSKEGVVNAPDDLHLLGVWVFKAVPDKVEKPKETEKTPRTADNQSIALALSLTLASLASIAMLQRKRNNVK